MRIIFAYYIYLMYVRRDIFQAIADPTRREIIDLLSEGSLNVNAISENFDVSRQAISLHVKILEECGLVIIHKQGRERLCEVKLDDLQVVSEWVEQYRNLWEKRLDSLENYLHTLQKKKKNVKRK